MFPVFSVFSVVNAILPLKNNHNARQTQFLNSIYRNFIPSKNFFTPSSQESACGL